MGREKEPNATKQDTGNSRACIICRDKMITLNRMFIGLILNTDEWRLWRIQLRAVLPCVKGCQCMHQEVVTSELSQAYPEHTLEDRLE